MGAQAALKELLYGGKQRIDVQRLQRIADGFTSFTVDGLTTDPVEARL
jgi:aarF domain-containing kinase